MDRRTVVLGIAAAVAVIVAVAVTVFGRSSASPKHKAVAAYITGVDQIQQRMQVQLINTVSVYRAFANGAVPAKTLVPRLGKAELTLRRFQGRLVALPAPAPARRLRGLLIRLIGSEVSTAHEVGQLASFSPRFAVLLNEVRTAGSELARALAAVKPPQAHQAPRDESSGQGRPRHSSLRLPSRLPAPRPMPSTHTTRSSRESSATCGGSLRRRS